MIPLWFIPTSRRSWSSNLPGSSLHNNVASELQRLIGCIFSLFVSESLSCGSSVIRANFIDVEKETSPEGFLIQLQLDSEIFVYRYMRRHRAPASPAVSSRYFFFLSSSANLGILRSFKTLCLPVQDGKALLASRPTIENLALAANGREFVRVGCGFNPQLDNILETVYMIPIAFQIWVLIFRFKIVGYPGLVISRHSTIAEHQSLSGWSLGQKGFAYNDTVTAQKERGFFFLISFIFVFE